MTRRLSANEVAPELAAALDGLASSGERVVLERNGDEVAALVSLDDLRALEALEDRSDIEAGERALSEPGEDIPWHQLKAELDL